jgi:hypothetical protein
MIDLYKNYKLTICSEELGFYDYTPLWHSLYTSKKYTNTIIENIVIKYLKDLFLIIHKYMDDTVNNMKMMEWIVFNNNIENILNAIKTNLIVDLDWKSSNIKYKFIYNTSDVSIENTIKNFIKENLNINYITFSVDKFHIIIYESNIDNNICIQNYDINNIELENNNFKFLINNYIDCIKQNIISNNLKLNNYISEKNNITNKLNEFKNLIYNINNLSTNVDHLIEKIEEEYFKTNNIIDIDKNISQLNEQNKLLNERIKYLNNIP